MEDNSVLIKLDKVFTTIQQVREDVVQHWRLGTETRVAKDKGFCTLSMMYALQKACVEFKTAASSWEIKDSGKFTEHTAQLAQTVKDDVDVQMEKYPLIYWGREAAQDVFGNVAIQGACQCDIS